MRASTPILLVLAVLAATGLSWTPAASAAPSSIALGVNTSDAPGRDGVAIDEFTRRSGRTPAVVMWFQTFSEPLFYSSQLPPVDRRGAVPSITWEPTGVPLREIATGGRDAYLRASARAARDWGKPIFVRFAHEMNGGWYSWGRGVNGNSAADYVEAWRHVVQVFRDEGATNVRWVWAPNVFGHGTSRFEDLYPGDDWVDWVGLDGYNWGAAKASGWRDFSTLFGPSYDAMDALTSKPMMISETAAPEQGGDKAEWIAGGLGRELPTRMPRVRALVWFDRDKEADWRIDSSPSALAAFQGVATSSLFDLDRADLLAVGSRTAAPSVEEPGPAQPPAPAPAPASAVSLPAPGLASLPAPATAVPVQPEERRVPAPAAAPRPRPTLGSPRVTLTRGALRIRSRLRGGPCRRCSATLTIRRAGAARSVRMSRRGSVFSAVVSRRGRVAPRWRIALRDGSGSVIARSASR